MIEVIVEGGTCIYISNRLKFTSEFASISNKDIELQMITLLGNTCNAHCKEINVLVAYRPPSGSSKSGKEQLIAYCDSLPGNQHRELLILGDFNWDVSGKVSSCNKLVTDIEELLGVEQLIRCPTRVTIHTGSVIDLVFSNVSNIAWSGCLNYTIIPVFIVKKREIIKNQVKYVFKRNFRHYDKTLFQERLNNLDWSVIDQLNNVDEMWSMVLSGILYEANRLCPYL